MYCATNATKSNFVTQAESPDVLRINTSERQRKKMSRVTHNPRAYAESDNAKRNIKLKHCACCGDPFVFLRQDAKCCGRACRDKKNRSAKPKNLHTKHCAFCGQPFTCKRSDQRCCCKAHKQKLYRQLKALA